jgi:predicted methyltransferase
VTSPPEPRTEVVAHVDLGVAELIPDPKRPQGWMLMIDGIAQSYVDLADPTHLEFAYVRRVAAAIDAVRRSGQPVCALHLGGGAWCLPRYVAATRPGSKQRVVERDEALAALIRKRLPLRKSAEVIVELGDARDAVEATPAGTYDLVISDVFEGAQMPAQVASVEFAAQVARLLRDDGLYVVNVTDLPALAFTRRLAATLRECFHDVAVIAEHGMLRGRRFGNAVLVAAGAARKLPGSRLTTLRPGETITVKLVCGAELDAFTTGAEPIRD